MLTSSRLLPFLLALTGANIVSAQQGDPLAIFRETIVSPGFPVDGPDRPAPRQRPNNGPWNNDVIVYRSTADGNVEKIFSFERAGVPTIARLKDGRIIAAHQHFPADDPANFDKVAVHFSSDEGKTWTAPAVIHMNGLPEGMRYPFDPTLVPLPDGRIRMYFTSLHGRQFDEDIPAIYSGISTDGIEYTFEPGMRFGINDRNVIDCAVVLHQGVVHLFSPDNGAHIQGRPRPGEDSPESDAADGIGYHATSPDGLTFIRVDDVQIEGHRHWLGNAQSDGKVITFYGTGQALLTLGKNNGDRFQGSLWMATSADGKTWQPAASPIVRGGDPGGLTISDNNLLIVITGEPRADRQQPPPQRDPGTSGQKSKF